MPTASRVPAKPTTPPGPTTPGGYAQLAAGGALLRRASGRSVVKRVRRRNLKRLAFGVVLAAVAVYVLWKLFLVTVGIVTTDMWFDSVRAGSVYHTEIEAQVLLFAVFGVIAGALGGLTLFLVRRIAPLPVSADDDTFRWTFRKYERRIWPLLAVLAVVVPGVLVGRQAQSGWQTYLLWQNAKPFHTTDPLFHKDIAFFIDIYPFHQMVVSLLLQTVAYALWIAVVAGYWYGAWRLRRGSRKVTRGIVQLASVLAGVYLVLKAANYWESRYALTTSPRGPVTGAGYTDVHAALPARYVLVGVALLCAVALFASGFLTSRVRVLAGAVALIVVASLAIGSGWPGLVYHFQEAPSAAKLDLNEIANNQKATRAAFGLDGDVTTVRYNPATTTNPQSLVSLTNKTAQTPVIDPNQLSPTFNVEQQLQAYYGFKSTLDIDHYVINGRTQDVALAVRELRSSGIPQQSWVNQHLVYTHGYGVVAAPTTKVDPTTESPVFYNGGLPPAQQIPVTRPQVYFGQAFGSGNYAIVGQPKGSSKKLEFDHPGSTGSSTSAHNTYSGDGGIPVGSLLRRFLFAVQLKSPNVLFSSELNSASQLLTVRNPRARVAQVAPWLTLDGDTYPAVVNGHIEWVVDGYTTSSNYPDSQLINLHKATSTSLTANGASVIQPNTQLNYMQNSVKAVVDAYTGKVTLYEWNQARHPDPLLKSWESAFPGLVKSQSSIPSALLTQLRYPTDLFNVQRYLLAKYHVKTASNFYSGNDFWTVPTDPTVGGNSVKLPSRYISMSADGYGAQRYSLSSPMVTLNGRQLASFVYVNSEPGPDYGKFTVLDFPSGAGGEAPSQVQNDIESNTTITEQLTLQRGGNSKVVLGDPVAIPVAGQILYVEPVYTQSSGSSSFPILRHVIALYGNGQPSFDDSLLPALKAAFVSGARTG